MDAPPQAVVAWLLFAAAKRPQHIRECRRPLAAAIAAHAAAPGAEVVSGDELRAILANAAAALDARLEAELANAYHSGALAIGQLLQPQADGASASFHLPALDAARLEDGELLRAMAAAEAAALARPAAAAAAAAGPGPVAGLAAGAAAAASERRALAVEVEALRARELRLLADAEAARGEARDLKQRLEAAQDALAAARRGAAVTEAERDADAARRLDAAVEAARAERLQGCKQFRQLRTLMRERSAEAVALRRRLARYEPAEEEAGEGLVQEERQSEDEEAEDDEGGCATAATSAAAGG